MGRWLLRTSFVSLSFEALKLCIFELACGLVLLCHLLAGQAHWWKLISLYCCWEIKKQRVEHPTQSFKQRWVPLTKQPLLIRQLRPQEVKWVLCKARHDRVLSRSDVVQTNVSHLLGMKVRQEEKDDCRALFKIHWNWPHQPTNRCLLNITQIGHNGQLNIRKLVANIVRQHTPYFQLSWLEIGSTVTISHKWTTQSVEIGRKYVLAFVALAHDNICKVVPQFPFLGLIC